MTDQQKEKIKRFLADETMSNAVREVLVKSFLTTRVNQDVYILAASRLAFDFLEAGWRELRKFQSDAPSERNGSNPGV